MNNPYECKQCHEALDSDLKLLDRFDRHRLPVSCKVCPYTVCYTCFVDKMANGVERGYIDCPSCGNGVGFYVSDEPDISPFACLLLSAAKKKPTPTAKSRKVKSTRRASRAKEEGYTKLSDGGTRPHPADNKVERSCEATLPPTNENVIYLPSNDDGSPSADIPQQSERNKLKIPPKDSETHVVTQSQPDDGEEEEQEDDDDTVSEASSPLWDGPEEKDRPPVQATQSNADPSGTVSTPRRSSTRKRKLARSLNKFEEESKEETTVVSPSPKRRRRRRRKKSDSQQSSPSPDAAESQAGVPSLKRPPPRPLDAFISIERMPARHQAGLKSDCNKSKEIPFVSDCSQQELEALKHRFKWIDEFKEYLENDEADGKKLSETNVQRTFASINGLRLGYGVNYAPKKEFSVEFMKGIKIDLSMNIDKMLEDAKAFEEIIGKDKSHGWIARHPLKKLALFQQHVLNKIRTGSPNFPTMSDGQ